MRKIAVLMAFLTIGMSFYSVSKADLMGFLDGNMYDPVTNTWKCMFLMDGNCYDVNQNILATRPTSTVPTVVVPPSTPQTSYVPVYIPQNTGVGSYTGGSPIVSGNPATTTPTQQSTATPDSVNLVSGYPVNSTVSIGYGGQTVAAYHFILGSDKLSTGMIKEITFTASSTVANSIKSISVNGIGNVNMVNDVGYITELEGFAVPNGYAGVNIYVSVEPNNVPSGTPIQIILTKIKYVSVGANYYFEGNIPSNVFTVN